MAKKKKNLINKFFLIGFLLPLFITTCAGIVASLGGYYIQQSCLGSTNSMCSFPSIFIAPFALVTGPAFLIVSSIGLTSTDPIMKFMYIVFGGIILGLICGSVFYILNKVSTKKGLSLPFVVLAIILLALGLTGYVKIQEKKIEDTKQYWADKNWKVLKSFTSSQGELKYVVVITDSDVTNRLYFSSDPNKNKNAQFISKISQAWHEDSPSVSNNSSKKYLYFTSAMGEGVEYLIFDEDGNIIPLDLSTVGLGTVIKPQYGISFREWVGDSNNFIVDIGNANGEKYEAIFDATTGKQIGKTRQIQSGS